MSFKREGDDQSWLNILSRRRISELFAENIPEDEAFLMKNGRFACLVCNYRPVFDTVATLAVHRSGKKHGLEAEKFFARKNDLAELKFKRQHDDYLKHGFTSKQSGQTSSSTPGNHCLLSTCVYDSRVKRRNAAGPYCRRQTVDIVSDGLSSAALTADSSSSLRLSLDQTPPQTIADILKQRRMQAATENPDPLKPYVGKRCAAIRMTTAERRDAVSSCSRSLRTARAEPVVAVTLDCSDRRNEAVPVTDSRQLRVSHEDSCASATTEGSQICTVSGQQKERAEKFFAAVGSGWKRSRDGTWIKDEEAEFDSDDEPPDNL